jgi:type III pantothenate kinase
MTTSNARATSTPADRSTPVSPLPIRSRTVSSCASDSSAEPTWVGLMIGNSRLHWGAFIGDRCCGHWQSSHRRSLLPSDATTWGAPATLSLVPDIPLIIASVVPEQRRYIGDRAHHDLSLADIPIPGLYPSLGIDRGLGLWHAAQSYGGPILVIDGGTALTLSALDDQGQFCGGAILPGLGLQLRSLGQTGQLPQLNTITHQPARWAMTTADAIASGLYYGLQATVSSYCNDWLDRFPGARIVITGGDGRLLQESLGQPSARLDPHLVVGGLGLTGARRLAWGGEPAPASAGAQAGADAQSGTE